MMALVFSNDFGMKDSRVKDLVATLFGLIWKFLLLRPSWLILNNLECLYLPNSSYFTICERVSLLRRGPLEFGM